MSTRLAEWLKAHDLTVAEAARRMGEKHQTVLNWVHGTRMPRWRGLAKIAELTGGEITSHDFVRECHERLAAETARQVAA